MRGSGRRVGENGFRFLVLFAYALAALVFGVRSVAGAASLVVDSSLPVVGGHGLAIVTSGSMEPAIRRGDVVFTRDVQINENKPTDSLGIEVDDVISYSGVDNKNLTVTHRVVARTVTDDGVIFETKGDAVDDKSFALVPGARVTGKVVAVIPSLGLVLIALSSRLLIAASAVLLLTALFARGWSNPNRRPRTQSPPSTDGD